MHAVHFQPLIITSHLTSSLIPHSVLPLASRRRRRSIHALALAVSPLSVTANEIRVRRSAALRRRRRRFKHLGLPGRVLVLGILVFVLVAFHAVPVALATAGSAALVFFFLGAGFCYERKVSQSVSWYLLIDIAARTSDIASAIGEFLDLFFG